MFFKVFISANYQKKSTFIWKLSKIPGHQKHLMQHRLKGKALLKVSEMSQTVAEQRQNPQLELSEVMQPQCPTSHVVPCAPFAFTFTLFHFLRHFWLENFTLMHIILVPFVTKASEFLFSWVKHCLRG